MSGAHDVVVIGGGLIGLACAIAARERGFTVRLLEAERGSRHASSASAGGVRSLNRHPAEIALARAALPLWATMRERVGHDCGFRVSGQIRVAEDEAALGALERRRARLVELGYGHEILLSARELRRRVPALAPHCRGALAVEDDGFADPLASVHAFRRHAQRLGVVIEERTRVVGIARDGDGLRLEHVVSSDLNVGRDRAPDNDPSASRDAPDDSGGVSRPGHPDRVISSLAASVVNAAGAWGGTLAALAGDAVPCRIAALQMTVTAPLRPFVAAVLGSEGRKLSLKQTDAGALVIGGGWEGEIVGDARGPPRGRVVSALVAHNLGHAVSLFPHLAGARVVRTWAGLEGMLEDDLPAIGASPALPGLVHAFGFSGHGFALVPLVGPLVADLLEGRDPSLALDAFDPARFPRSDSHRREAAA